MDCQRESTTIQSINMVVQALYPGKILYLVWTSRGFPQSQVWIFLPLLSQKTTTSSQTKKMNYHFNTIWFHSSNVNVYMLICDTSFFPLFLPMSDLCCYETEQSRIPCGVKQCVSVQFVNKYIYIRNKYVYPCWVRGIESNKEMNKWELLNQPMRVQFVGLPCTVIISLSE